MEKGWIENYQKNALIKSVEALGHEDVAAEMKNLLSIQDDDNTVNFFFEDNLPFLNSQLYDSIFLRPRKEDFKKTLFTIDDIKKVTNKIGSKIVKFDKNRFEELSNEFGSPKNQIFKDDILQYFISKNKFNVDQFSDFILKTSRIQLALFAIYSKKLTHEEYLNDDELRNFINLFITHIPKLKEILANNEDFCEYYVEIAANRFIFHLSSFQNVKIDISTLVKSPIFYKFVFYEDYPRGPFDYENVYKIYVRCSQLLDDDSQYLSEKTIKNFSRCIFTDAFTKRLFEVVEADSQHFIDFTVFLQIYFSLTYITTEQGTHYFFQILDLDGDGIISRSDIFYFYKAIIKECDAPYDFDCFLAKLLDIIGCQSESVTEDVLNNSKNQDLFFKLLIDQKTFKKWEKVGEEEEECPDDIIETE